MKIDCVANRHSIQPRTYLLRICRQCASPAIFVGFTFVLIAGVQLPQNYNDDFLENVFYSVRVPDPTAQNFFQPALMLLEFRRPVDSLVFGHFRSRLA